MITPRWILVFALLAPSTLGAHVFWVAPSTFVPEIGSRLDLQLLVGDGTGKEEAYPRNPKHIREFVAVSEAGKHDVAGITGRDPAGSVRATTPGWTVVGYRSQQNYVVLGPRKFAAYLAEEGLEHIARERDRRGETRRPGREHFSRCAKSLVLVGDAPDRGRFDRVLGFDLELIPEQNPHTHRSGENFPVRLELRGKPLVGTRVQLFRKGHAGAVERATTDAAGRVELDLAGGGDWLVAAVHMERADAASPADWVSLWASLTFQTLPTANP